MKPYQFKMTTGAIYVGFPSEDKGSPWVVLHGACNSAFISSEGRYDIRGLFTSTDPTELNLGCVQAKQECNDYTDSTYAYCRYIGALISAMKEEELAIPEVFLEYIKHIDPFFMEAFDGVGVLDAGAYDYAVTYNTGDQDKLRQKMERIAREYHSELVTDEEKTCSSNVVALHFGSNKNAPEKG
jgi:hypothetical protein